MEENKEIQTQNENENEEIETEQNLAVEDTDTAETAESAEIDESDEPDTTSEVEDESIHTEETPRQGKKASRRGKRRKIETIEPLESEWREQVVQIRRVTKVVKGGKKLSFRAIVIVGNKKGQVGMGVAKAAEVIIAIQKAVADARKNLINVPLFNSTIPHMITGKSGAGSVILRPASKGTGVIAGGAVRAVLELSGIENILSKSLGSKSPLNAANATLNALKSLRTFKEAAKIRNISIKEMLGQQA